jgi:sulfite exporter TauE/SafE
VRSNRFLTYAAIAGALAVAGWIWALSNADMPDALWVLTVVLTVVAVVLALYALLRDRRRGTDVSPG